MNYMRDTFDEIMSLDPTFDLYGLYQSLVKWHASYNSIKTNKFYPLYDALSGCDYKIDISKNFRVIIYSGNVDDVYNAMSSVSYITPVRDGNTLMLRCVDANEIRDILMEIDRIVQSHPLNSVYYMANRCKHTITYRYQHYNNPSKVSSPNEYDEVVYKAITELDSSISMTYLLEHTKKKISLEKKSNIYRGRIGDMIDKIHDIHLHYDSDNSITIDWKGRYDSVPSHIDDALPLHEGWNNYIDEDYLVSTYTGDDHMDVMLSLVLIDRINGNYPTPIVNGNKTYRHM